MYHTFFLLLRYMLHPDIQIQIYSDVSYIMHISYIYTATLLHAASWYSDNSYMHDTCMMYDLSCSDIYIIYHLSYMLSMYDDVLSVYIASCYIWCICILVVLYNEKLDGASMISFISIVSVALYKKLWHHGRIYQYNIQHIAT